MNFTRIIATVIVLVGGLWLIPFVVFTSFALFVLIGASPLSKERCANMQPKTRAAQIMPVGPVVCWLLEERK